MQCGELVNADKEHRLELQAFDVLDVEYAHVAFLPHSLALSASDDLDVVLGQGDVQRVGQRSNVVLGVHKNGGGWQLADKALNLANAIS